MQRHDTHPRPEVPLKKPRRAGHMPRPDRLNKRNVAAMVLHWKNFGHARHNSNFGNSAATQQRTKIISRLRDPPLGSAQADPPPPPPLPPPSQPRPPPLRPQTSNAAQNN
ncbi:hypothetical protein E2C01_074501 [Portunus trituberculatus]|uniref:Uncharacterized protein n=1 Tax=Portunus trituberculatus TaxID=210409 RepID=A0A5B7I865_PORTR|nr:hypothetical protein [Portunus trituberculatus]